MIRLILIVILIFIIYRLLKGLFSTDKKIRRNSSGKVIDEMVQDPMCKTYVPRREAVRAVVRGKEYYFCSERCAAEFKKENDTK